MERHISITIDGAKLRVPAGSSVLDAAVLYGICIPHLCHLRSVSDIGACRLCVVEQVKNGRSKVTASCTLEATDGMDIRANSDRIRHIRQNIAELLVTEAPNSRAIQDIAMRCGVRETRFPFRNNNCVLCGRCVRVCSELWRGEAISFVGRGKNRHVEYPFGTRPEFCRLCGGCVMICPMTLPPCDGPMKKGQERLCSKCASGIDSQDSTWLEGHCTWCEMGKGFQCSRHD